jgi:hypothetical protein
MNDKQELFRSPLYSFHELCSMSHEEWSGRAMPGAFKNCG